MIGEARPDRGRKSYRTSRTWGKGELWIVLFFYLFASMEFGGKPFGEDLLGLRAPCRYCSLIMTFLDVIQQAQEWSLINHEITNTTFKQIQHFHRRSSSQLPFSPQATSYQPLE